MPKNTVLRNVSDPAQRKLAIEAATIRNKLLSDITTIEQRDGAAESARMQMLVHSIDFALVGGVNLRVEEIGTLETDMLTAKDAWVQTSFAPALGMSWKTLAQGRKAILKEAAIVLHFCIKSKVIFASAGKGKGKNDRKLLEVSGKRLNKNDEMFLNMEYATDALKDKAKGAPIYPFSFSAILRAAKDALAGEGNVVASAIEQLAQKLIKALDEKTHDDIPAAAWNDLSVVAGRISTLLAARDKARAEHKSGKGKGTKARGKELPPVNRAPNDDDVKNGEAAREQAERKAS